MPRFVLITAFLFIASPAFAQPAKPTLRAGAFAQDITPEKYPVSVNGGLADRLAKAANDPLHARCLVLDDGKTKLAIVVVDSCMIPRELMDAAKAIAEKKTGIPAANMLISATHTHTAPTVAGVFQSDPDAGYVSFLTEKIAAGIEKAHANLAPAKAAWVVGHEPTQLFNRRFKMKDSVLNTDPFGGTTDKAKTNPGRLSADIVEPVGPIDPSVTVLSLRTADDKPLVLFANYSLHYVGDLPALSADYFGVFCELIGQKLKAGPGFVAMMSNATSGDINNNNNVKEAPAKTKPGDRCRLVADTVAEAVMKALEKAEYRSDVSLSSAGTVIELPVRKPTPEEVKRAEGILDKAKDRELKGFEEVYARETVKMATYPDTVKVPLQVFRVGELAIAQIPCEVFVEVGLAIKKTSPLKPTCVVSLANGYFGYLPTPAHHALGGYETWRARSSFLGVMSSEEIEKGIGALLKQLK